MITVCYSETCCMYFSLYFLPVESILFQHQNKQPSFMYFRKHFFLCYRGQNPLHVLCQYGRDNAAAIFELFKECMPEYPIAKVDADGSTGKHFNPVPNVPIFNDPRGPAWLRGEVSDW